MPTLIEAVFPPVSVVLEKIWRTMALSPAITVLGSDSVLNAVYGGRIQWP